MVTKDLRDSQNWAVMELTRQGEMRADDGTLAGCLREALDVPSDHPVFIPAVTYLRDGHRVTVHLMEGYAFVAAGLQDTCYLNLEKDCPYVRRVLSSPGGSGMQVLSVISSHDIDEMRAKLRAIIAQDINVGMQVRINQGTYAKLDGEVVGVQGDDAHVHIKLRSFEVIRTVPKVFLEPVEEEENS